MLKTPQPHWMPAPPSYVHIVETRVREEDRRRTHALREIPQLVTKHNPPRKHTQQKPSKTNHSCLNDMFSRGGLKRKIIFQSFIW